MVATTIQFCILTISYKKFILQQIPHTKIDLRLKIKLEEHRKVKHIAGIKLC